MNNKTYNVIMTLLVTTCIGLTSWALVQIVMLGKNDATREEQVVHLESDVDSIMIWRDYSNKNGFMSVDGQRLKQDLRLEFIEKVDNRYHLILKDLEYMKKQIDNINP